MSNCFCQLDLTFFWGGELLKAPRRLRLDSARLRSSMTARLFFDSQKTGPTSFLDQKDCAQLAQWVWNITQDREHFDRFGNNESYPV